MDHISQKLVNHVIYQSKYCMTEITNDMKQTKSGEGQIFYKKKNQC